MPLLLAEVGSENVIRKIGGNPEVRTHLENLGFVVGGKVDDNLYDWRKSDCKCQGDPPVAISREMAGKIMVRSMFYIDKVRRQCYENIEAGQHWRDRQGC